MMFEPGERDTPVAAIAGRLEQATDATGLFLGAFVEERLVGFISLMRGNANRTRHSAYIVMGVLAAHTGKGIGKALLQAAETWAVAQGLTRLELTVMTHNTHAVKLYSSMGFVQEGTKPQSLKVDGTYVDEYYMGKLL